MKAIHYSFLVVAFVYLAACGGGGGTTTTDAGGNQIRTTNYPNWVVSNASRARTIAQGEILNRTAAEIRSLILSRRNSATRLIASDFLEGSLTRPGVRRTELTCPGGRTCTYRGGSYSLDDLTPSLNVAEYQPLFTRNGIDIGQVRSRLENAPTTGQHRNILFVGGILDNSFFGIGITGFYRGTQLYSAIGTSLSFGNSPGTNPSSTISSATWTGVMLGIDYSQVTTNSLDQLHALHGDSRIVVEGLDTTPTVDVTFSNVRNLNTGARHTLGGWSNIPLSNGIFRTGSETNQIEGTFYGTEHQEVGGHFERGQIVGAFGGKRP